MVAARRWAAAAAIAAAAGCGAEHPPGSTGGVSVPAGPCGRGIVVASSDYQSTNVSLVSFDGRILSSSFLSSAGETQGLSVPLGGDVVLPTMPSDGPVVLIDRGASALTWVEVETARVSAQRSIDTGSARNPHDYARVSDHKAYVPRFDGPGDLAVLDPTTGAVSASVDLSVVAPGVEARFLRRPDRVVVAGGCAYVTVQLVTASFLESRPSRLVVLDAESDAIVSDSALDGLHACTGLAVSPGGDEIAIVCAGSFGGDAIPNVDESAVVTLSLSDPAVPVERRRLSARDLAGLPLAFSIAYAGPSSVLVTALGDLARDVDDAVVWADLETGEAVTLRRPAAAAGGDVACAARCGACFVADAAARGGVLVRYLIGPGGRLEPGSGEEIVVDRRIGLPPRYLGRF